MHVGIAMRTLLRLVLPLERIDWWCAQLQCPKDEWHATNPTLFMRRLARALVERIVVDALTVRKCAAALFSQLEPVRANRARGRSLFTSCTYS